MKSTAVKCGIGAAVALIVWLAVSHEPDVRIVDTKWEVREAALDVTSVAQNRTSSSQNVTIEFIADHHSYEKYDRALSFVGSRRVDLTIPPNSSVSVDASIPRSVQTGDDIAVSATIVLCSPSGDEH